MSTIGVSFYGGMTQCCGRTYSREIGELSFEGGHISQRLKLLVVILHEGYRRAFVVAHDDWVVLMMIGLYQNAAVLF